MGTRHPGSMRSHADPGREREATHRAITLAELSGCRLSSSTSPIAKAMEEIRRAQARALKIKAETCSQYLVLTEDDLQGLKMEGAKYVCFPAAARQGKPDSLLGRFADRCSSRCSLRTIARSATDDEQRQADAEGPNEFPLGAERHSGRRGPVADSCFRKASARAGSTSIPSSLSRQRTTPRRMGSIRGGRDDRHRLGRRHRDLGPGKADDDHQRPISTQCRLHALRRHRGQGLAWF